MQNLYYNKRLYFLLNFLNFMLQNNKKKQFCYMVLQE